MARRARGAAGASGRGRVRRLADRGGPPGRRADRDARRTCSSSAGRSTSNRLGDTSRPVATPGSPCGSTATSSPRSARCGWPSSSARARSTTWSRRAARGSRRWPRATSSACCCRSPRSTWTGRCLPAARSSTRAPRSRSRRTSTQAAPTARAFRSSARSPARSSASLPRRRSRRAPSTRRTFSGLPIAAASRPGYAPTSSFSTRPTGGTWPTTSRATSCGPSIRAGRVVLLAGIIDVMANQKQRRRRAKEKRHQYDLVEIDGEGNETVLSASDVKSRGAGEAGEESPRRARRRRAPAAARRSRRRGGAC